jgi:hypothetical protein
VQPTTKSPTTTKAGKIRRRVGGHADDRRITCS